MAHPGKEIRFCPVGSLGRRQGIPKQLLLAGLFRPLGIQDLNQVNGKHVAVKRILHIDDLHGNPMIPSVAPNLLELHIDVAFPSRKAFHYMPAPEVIHIIFLVSRIHKRTEMLQHPGIAALPLSNVYLMPFYKAVIGIFGQVQAHDQGVRGTDCRLQ